MSDSAIPGGTKPASIAPFVYHPAPGWNPAPEPEEAVSLAPSEAVPEVATAIGEKAVPPKANENHAAREQSAWEAGLREGMARAERASGEALQKEKDAVTNALRDFAKERDEYFHSVEGEVVALALAIVRKILKRETQLDPLLLSGLVRVALEKMAAGSGVRLLVHPEQVRIWQEFLSRQVDLPIVPELAGDPGLGVHECRIESDHGSTEVSLESQLKEIEQGLFDLLAQRPNPR